MRHPSLTPPGSRAPGPTTNKVEQACTQAPHPTEDDARRWSVLPGVGAGGVTPPSPSAGEGTLRPPGTGLSPIAKQPRSMVRVALCAAPGPVQTRRPRLPRLGRTCFGARVPESKSCSERLCEGARFSHLGHGDGGLPGQGPSMNELRRTQCSEQGRPHTKSLSTSVVHAEDEPGQRLAGTQLTPHTQPCPQVPPEPGGDCACPGCSCY